MDELHTGPKQPLSGKKTLSPTLTSTWYPLDANQMERATASSGRSITWPTLGLEPSGLGQLPT